MDNRLLEILKRAPSREFRSNARTPVEFTPQVFFGNAVRGACLRMVDRKQRPCEPDALQLSGPLRRLVHAWNDARTSDAEVLAWQVNGGSNPGSPWRIIRGWCTF